MALGFFVLSFSIVAWTTRRLVDRQKLGGNDLSPDYRALALILSAALLLCAIGVLPSAYAVIRPENILILTISVVLLSLSIDESDRPPLRYVVTIAMVFLYSMSVYVHPKALYLFPALLLSIIHLSIRTSKVSAGAACAVLGWVSYAGYHLLRRQLSCPEVESVNAFLKSQSIDPLALFVEPTAVLEALIHNSFSLNSWSRLISHALFKGGYEIGYLPDVQNTGFILWMTNGLIVCSVAMVFLAAIAFFYLHLQAAWNAIRRYFRASLPDAVATVLVNLVLLMLYLGIFVQMFLNLARHWYDFAFWIISLVLLVVVSTATFGLYRTQRGGHRLMMKGWIVAVYACAAVTAGISNYRVFRTIYQDLKKGYAGPGISLRDFDYAAVKHEVEETLQQCGLKRNSPRLVVDDLTYSVVHASYKVIPVTYASLIGAQQSLELAKSLGSAGLIARCANLSMEVTLAHLYDIRQHNSLCCLSF